MKHFVLNWSIPYRDHYSITWLAAGEINSGFSELKEKKTVIQTG